MPSKRKQINVRTDDATERLIPALVAAIEATTGLTPSQSDLFRLGIRELAAKYGVAMPEMPKKPKPKK